MTARRAAALVAGNTLVLVGLLVFVEGASSVVRFVHGLQARPWAPAEAYHTRYDPDLGWAHVPGFHRDNMYGTGISLSINRQGFRADEEYSADPPPGCVRAICSGDSFTLGHGVDDHETWCHLLEADVPGLQTINMGQAAYGIDQAYLWYVRDGERFRHSLQLFAYIDDDFRRMAVGEGKPILRIAEGGLVTDNVPVPRVRWRWLTLRARVLRELDTWIVLSAALRRLGVWAPPPTPAPPLELLDAVVHDLKRLNDARGSTLVLLRLPAWGTWPGIEHRRVAEAAKREGVAVFDLGDEYAVLSPMQQRGLFILEEAVHPGGANHYSAAGNRWAATVILDRLRADPALAAALPRP